MGNSEWRNGRLKHLYMFRRRWIVGKENEFGKEVVSRIVGARRGRETQQAVRLGVRRWAFGVSYFLGPGVWD
jgi:hypothetical protein